MPATLYAVANPEEPRQPRPNSVVTIEDVMDAVNKAQALHPDWFKPGLGWGKQPDDQENTK